MITKILWSNKHGATCPIPCEPEIGKRKLAEVPTEKAKPRPLVPDHFCFNEWIVDLVERIPTAQRPNEGNTPTSI